MDLTPWAPAIAVGGVVLGIAVTSVTEAMRRRQTSALSIAEQKAALRNDRREAIFAFIDATQRVFQIAASRQRGERFEPDDTTREAEHDLYFRQNCIDVLCSDELRSAADMYASKMFWILMEPFPEEANLYDHAHDEEKKFFILARKELYAPNVSD